MEAAPWCLGGTIADMPEDSSSSMRPSEPDNAAVKALLDAVAAGAHNTREGAPPRAASESQLLELVYGELRAIAGSFFKAERRDHTLEPTALVHEAFVRLVRSGEGSGVSYESRAHFVAIAARAMRQVLIDHARVKRAQKRGGDSAERITLAGLGTDSEAVDAIHVSEQLERLAQIDPRQAQIVEMRFFAGMTTKEIALVLGLSERTVELEWRMARAWLRRELDRESA